MAPKRRANASLPSKGLLPGERLDRSNITSSPSSSPWGWVGSTVTNAKNITLEHRLAACHLSSKKHASCVNKYAPQKPNENQTRRNSPAATGELDDDIIVISDDELPSCSKKGCKTNPNCLNYLGQQAWENECQSSFDYFERRSSADSVSVLDGSAHDAFFEAVKLGSDPSQDSREVDLPVGLKVHLKLSKRRLLKSLQTVELRCHVLR